MCTIWQNEENKKGFLVVLNREVLFGHLDRHEKDIYVHKLIQKCIVRSTKTGYNKIHIANVLYTVWSGKG